MVDNGRTTFGSAKRLLMLEESMLEESCSLQSRMQAFEVCYR